MRTFHLVTHAIRAEHWRQERPFCRIVGRASRQTNHAIVSLPRSLQRTGEQQILSPIEGVAKVTRIAETLDQTWLGGGHVRTDVENAIARDRLDRRGPVNDRRQFPIQGQVATRLEKPLLEPAGWITLSSSGGEEQRHDPGGLVINRRP